MYIIFIIFYLLFPKSNFNSFNEKSMLDHYVPLTVYLPNQLGLQLIIIIILDYKI